MDDKIIPLNGTIKMGHHSKEGLIKKDGKTVYDDKWLHPEVDSDMEDDLISAINKRYRTKKQEQVEKTEKSVSLEIDLSKGMRTIDRGKLVQRRVPVHGKNGKIFYRLQWVDPTTGQPVSKQPKQQETSKKKSKKPVGESVEAPIEREKPKVERTPPVEVTKKKIYDLNTRFGKIEKFIDELSRDEKERMLEKYGIQWDRHDHPMKDWMNAIMALKKYAHDHPEIAGAEHLPDEGAPARTPEGTENVQDLMNSLPREELYKLMKEAGIADEDPYTVPKYEKTAKIRDFNNKCMLKKYLKDNPQLMSRLTKGTSDTPPIVRPVPGSKPTSSAKSAAQKGGNTIKGILDSMSSERKYALMKQLSIADEDPRLNPKYGPKDKGGNGMAAMLHMHNMMKLKDAIQDDPSILNYDDSEKTILSQDEQDRLAGMNEKQQQENDIKEFVRRMGKDMKNDLLDKYAEEPEIFDRKTSDDENIDWMYAMGALKQLFTNKPKLMEENRQQLENEELMNKKITNKQMEKILRRFLGAKGEYAQVVQAEKNKEWDFGSGSFARIEKDNDGTPILSVVDTGDEGDEWNEHRYSLKEVHEYLQDLSDSSSEEFLPEARSIPLHERNIIEIERAMQQSVDKFYTPEVGEVLKKYMADIWNTAGKSDSLEDLAKETHKMKPGTLAQIFHKWGIKSENGKFDYKNTEWKKIAYGKMVTDVKSGNANDYLIKNPDGTYDTWALHESAKQWSPGERATARRDMISSRMDLGDYKGIGDKQEVMKKMTKHFHDSTDFIPFDLFTDVLASGMKIKFMRTVTDAKGKEQANIGNSFEGDDNEIHINHSYLSDDLVNNATSAFTMQPPSDENGYMQHRFSDTVCHEMAHAIDHFLSQGSGQNFLNWNTETGRKYVPDRYRDCVHESYDKAVYSSNPQIKVGKMGSEVQPFYYHKDEWASVYEGRLYGDPATDPAGYQKLKKLPDGSLADPDMRTDSRRGIEHWSTSVANYASALQAYKDYQKNNPEEAGKKTLLDWAHEGYLRTKQMGYAGDYEASTPILDKDGNKTQRSNKMYQVRREDPSAGYGYDYYAMTKYHPDVSKAILNILNRGDFLEDRTSYKPSEAYREGDYTRKSEELVIEL